MKFKIFFDFERYSACVAYMDVIFLMRVSEFNPVFFTKTTLWFVWLMFPWIVCKSQPDPICRSVIFKLCSTSTKGLMTKILLRSFRFIIHIECENLNSFRNKAIAIAIDFEHTVKLSKFFFYFNLPEWGSKNCKKKKEEEKIRKTWYTYWLYLKNFLQHPHLFIDQ